MYGLGCLVVDLNLKSQVMETGAVAEGEAPASSSASKAPSAKNSKTAAMRMKQQAKHPVWHAFRMYMDIENLHKEWIIADTCRELHVWYHRQALSLQGTCASFTWSVKQCAGDYWLHIKKTLEVIAGTSHFSRWGIAVDFPAGTLDNSGILAHIEQHNDFAGYIGDMCAGIAMSRMVWGLDYLFGWPKRFVLLAAEHGAEEAVQEFKDYWKVHEKMMTDCLACREKALRKPAMQHATTLQFYHLLRKNELKLSDECMYWARWASSTIFVLMMRLKSPPGAE